jgi:hypothetical protein
MAQTEYLELSQPLKALRDGSLVPSELNVMLGMPKYQMWVDIPGNRIHLLLLRSELLLKHLGEFELISVKTV